MKTSAPNVNRNHSTR